MIISSISRRGETGLRLTNLLAAPPVQARRTVDHQFTGHGVCALLISALLLLSGAAPLWAAPQPRVLFGEEQFVRTKGAPDIFQRTFTVPPYVSAPYSLHIINGAAGSGKRIDHAVSSGRVLIDGIEVVSPDEFSKTVATINKTLTLAVGPHTLEVRLASAWDSNSG